MIYFKENPKTMVETLRNYEDPHKYLLKISSFQMLKDMKIDSPSDVSFNCKCCIKLNKNLSEENYC